MSAVKLDALITIMVDSKNNRPTLGDIKAFVEMADKFKLPDNTELLDCVLSIDIPTFSAEPITCGEHVPTEDMQDVLVQVHRCMEVPIDQPLWFEPSDTAVKEMGIS
jgi:hypothetical protein